MINTKKLMKMAKKWQQRAALHRKRISFQKSSAATSSTAVEKGCFVVYTIDKTRFAFPLRYLSNSIFQALLKISEEEFGLPTGGPITLLFDSVFLEYLIKLVQRRMDEDTEKALLLSIFSGIGGWAMNRAIDHGFEIGPDLNLPAHFSPIFFPMGNAATGFFVAFALLAGVVGAASTISGLTHIRSWTVGSLQAAATAATVAWTLTLLAMGFAWKEIELQGRNARLKTMEAFLIILSVTQLLYIAAVHGVKKPT